MVGIIAGVLVSFSVFTITGHPKSKLNKKFPNKRVKNFQFFPRVCLFVRNRVVYLHHWVLMTPIYVYAQNIEKGFLQIDFVQGLLLGGIMQGLLFKDRFRLIFKVEDYEKVKHSSYHIPLLSRLRKII